MNGPHHRSGPEQPPVGLLADLQQSRIHIRLPARVFRLVGDLGTREPEGSLDLQSGCPALCIHRAPLAGPHCYHALFRHFHGSQIRGRLHQARYVPAHGQDTVRCSEKGRHHSPRHARLHCLHTGRHLLQAHLRADIGVCKGILGLQVRPESPHGGLQRLHLRVSYRCHRHSLPGYGIALVPAFDRAQMQFRMRIQEAGEKLHRIRPALVYIIPAMPSDSARNLDPGQLRTLRHGNSRIAENGSRIHTAGTADEELAFIFRIQIDQDFPGDETGFQSLGTVQPRLFGHSEKTLYPAGLQVGCQYSQLSRHTYTAVGAEGSVPGYHPAVFDHIFYRVSGEIVLYSRIFLADHVGMALEHGYGQIFTAWRSRPDDDHISRFIGTGFERMLFGEALQICYYLLFMTRLPGNARDFPEVVQYCF